MQSNQQGGKSKVLIILIAIAHLVYLFNLYINIYFSRQLTDNQLHTVEKDAFADLVGMERL